jgi:hypothetical protein
VRRVGRPSLADAATRRDAGCAAPSRAARRGRRRPKRAVDVRRDGTRADGDATRRRARMATTRAFSATTTTTTTTR